MRPVQFTYARTNPDDLEVHEGDEVLVLQDNNGWSWAERYVDGHRSVTRTHAVTPWRWPRH